jgi:hypothetical protein
MNRMLPHTRTVVCKACQRIATLNSPQNAAMIIARRQPTAAASVGVTSPE